MKIQSSFKDYYDYIEHVHGGDPSIKYVRDKLVKDKLPVKATLRNQWARDNHNLSNHNFDLAVSLDTLPNDRAFSDDKIYTFSWLVVCGKYYLLVTTTTKTQGSILLPQYQIETSVLNASKHTFFENLHYQNFGRAAREPNYYLGRHDENLDLLAKKIQQPVFIITDVNRAYGTKSKYNVTISNKIPVLQDFGFASIVPPNILFQEIYTYLMNVLRESPDLAPPVQVADKDRLVQHGFDLKQSFRHRK